jgi:hypothetical protein
MTEAGMTFSWRSAWVLLAVTCLIGAWLSGCGGGGGSGGDGSAGARAMSSDYIAVEASDVMSPAKYASAATIENTTRVLFGPDEMEYANVTAGPDQWSDMVRVEVLFSRTVAGKYALHVGTHPSGGESHDYGCFSGPWTAAEKEKAKAGYIGYFDANCGSVTITRHHIRFSGLTFSNEDTPGGRITVSADFGWPASNDLDGPIEVLAGSTSVETGTYWIEDTRSGKRNQTYHGLTLDESVLDTNGQLALYVYYRADDRRKFILDFDNEAHPGTHYTCTSSTWSQDELDTINTTPVDANTPAQAIPACPQGVVYDPSSRLLTLNNVELPSLSDSADILKVYYHGTWHDLWAWIN